MVCLLSTAYLPPIQYMGKFLTGEDVILETQENFQKQSFRNRCYIYGANGKQCLVIPVKKDHNRKMPIAGVEIDYRESWQANHIKSFRAAYRTSPFYEYYADGFEAFYAQKVERLFDWNLGLLHHILHLLQIRLLPGYTVRFEKTPANMRDFRNTIHPKTRLSRPDPAFKPGKYMQVFQERYGFIPNLSIVDLLFNEGPNALDELKKTVRITVI
jgi:hypothetical protein